MSLQLSGVDVWHGRIQVCFGVDIAVGSGEFVTIFGSNGAGKSSLFGAIAGLVASSGEIIVNGRRLDGVPARGRARQSLAFVPEGRRNLFSTLTVDENLRLALRSVESDERNVIRERIFALFPILRTRLNQVSGTMSGGEQQMLALAVAIGRRPAVILLDEPSQGLAPAVLDEIAAAIARLKPLGLTVLLAEQNHEFASRFTDRFINIEDGKVIDPSRDPKRVLAFGSA
jgi:branched-chain amino acid transport system ATP-binding protein